ncbi:MAG: hypothetical protein ACFCVE_09760 [Phycisphaerae bacterium]
MPELTLTQWLMVALLAAVVLLIAYLCFRFGKFLGRSSLRRAMAEKEQEMLTTQRNFRNVYEQEMNELKKNNAALEEKVAELLDRVEEYRKKAAGYGGLFSAGNKRADAMYALLLENEALEEKLMQATSGRARDQAEGVKESIRSAGYRRVLMSQIMSDERIKQYVAEILADEKRLPDTNGERKALPEEA